MKSKKKLPSNNPAEQVKVFVIPGGHKPERKTAGAVGFDLGVRAIVSLEFEKDHPERRIAYFDFTKRPEDTKARKRAQRVKKEGGGYEWVYVLPPHGRCVVASGITLDVPHCLCWYVRPRGSTPFRGIVVASADVPGDPDFRGEPVAVLINDSSKPFEIRHGQRLVQLVFEHAVRPELITVERHSALRKSKRGCGCNGSTGHH
ncbi:MAG: hypothetical protein AAB447_00510 [Patescibacteria group bacterium]